MKRTILVTLSFLLFAGLHAQTRAFLRQKIEGWGECKNVAMTLSGGDLGLYGKNGWAARGIPDAMSNKLYQLHDDGQLIDDVALTEDGSWFILYGDNGYSSEGAPSGLLARLKQWNDDQQVILSVTFNDAGDWIAITEKEYAASSSVIVDYIKEGAGEHGMLWAAHVTNDGLALCFAKGYKFFGNVPDGLKEKLQTTTMDVFRIVFLSDGCYFIADRQGHYAYLM